MGGSNTELAGILSLLNQIVQYVGMNFLARPNPPGRPKDPEKRAALIEAAGQLFCEHGYDAISVEAVAQAAGVSKLTVYSHFGDKEGLFLAAVQARCEMSMPHQLFVMDSELPLRESLQRIGMAFVQLIFAADVTKLYRTLFAQAATNPHLTEIFYNAGPRRTLDELEQFLKEAVSRNQLDIEHTRCAAEHFFVLLKGVQHMRLLLNLIEPLDQQALQHRVDEAVEVFLRAYGKRET
jgi:TetR/AcrR family transcriptional regulator, mexJK operon transcriptional repressor